MKVQTLDIAANNQVVAHGTLDGETVEVVFGPYNDPGIDEWDWSEARVSLSNPSTHDLISLVNTMCSMGHHEFVNTLPASLVQQRWQFENPSWV